MKTSSLIKWLLDRMSRDGDQELKYFCMESDKEHNKHTIDLDYVETEREEA